MSRSGIEYLDYTWGVFSGCQNMPRGICPVKACWALAITQRFKNHYPDGFSPRFYPEALDSPRQLRKSSRIGVGWVGDVIGYGWRWRRQIYEVIRDCPQHKFLFLTKNPERLQLWGTFPANAWVGVSVTGSKDYGQAIDALSEVKASIKFLSFEPLLEWGSELDECWEEGLEGINWVIIGAQTAPVRLPEIEWVHSIVGAADLAGSLVFMKDNIDTRIISQNAGEVSRLARVLDQEDETILEMELRQEVPGDADTLWD